MATLMQRPRVPFALALAASIVVALVAAAAASAAHTFFPAANSEVQMDSAQELAIETLARGNQSGQSGAAQYVVQDGAAWSTVWAQANATVMPAPPLPEVDFTREMVIAVFQGTKPSAGYSVNIARVLDSGNTVEVFVEDTSPGPQCFAASVLTSPYHIVKVQKVEKDIAFRVTPRVSEC